MKQIKDLKAGETFKDSFGEKLKVRVYFVTERGNRMFMEFRADREVEAA